YLCPILWMIVPVLYTYLTFYEMGDIPLTCPQDYTYETSEIRLACNIRLTNLLCMLVFPILCVLYGISVWILITCSKRTGQKCEFKSIQFLKLYKNALFSDNGYSRVMDEDDDDIDFEENRIIFDEEEEFIKAELDNFKSNSNLDL
ncbi:5866_t:CDS:2, partial [Dentiscutata heterogama]